MNLDLLFRLLAAHFLADFIFQPNDWVKDRKAGKINSGYLYLHTLIIFLLTFLAAFGFSFIWIVLVITLSHFLVDLAKSYIKNETAVIFTIDQSLHIMIILACWYIYTFGSGKLPQMIFHWYHSTGFWIYLVAYLILTVPSSVLISNLTSRWAGDLKDPGESLKDAGKWIGIIERILILTFIIFNRFEAIGFLLAAKSVFRFSEIKNGKEQKRTEYILIGTLLSFTISIAAGIAVKMLLRI